jgi:hypothetical protein
MDPIEFPLLDVVALDEGIYQEVEVKSLVGELGGD